MNEIPFEVDEDAILSKPAEQERPSRMKKAAVLIIGVFLLVLVLSYFLGYMAFDVIPGLVESSAIDSYTVLLKDGTSLAFDRSAYEELVNVFVANQGNETKVCLMGAADGNHLSISGLYHPLIIAQDFVSVTAASCPAGTIVSVHSHPLMRCTPSLQDYNALHSHKDAMYAAVMCEKGRMYFY
ncbi:MAG TPA: hypothetical protein HA362_07975 [Nanoarchaeota archaeon]|nr:hypothetical protein [Nanoarchaeota archaeon]